ncbi:MAG: hypothetical protein WC595_05835 [Candidatus Nanoarchaeia archaeon]
MGLWQWLIDQFHRKPIGDSPWNTPIVQDKSPNLRLFAKEIEKFLDSIEKNLNIKIGRTLDNRRLRAYEIFNAPNSRKMIKGKPPFMNLVFSIDKGALVCCYISIITKEKGEAIGRVKIGDAVSSKEEFELKLEKSRKEIESSIKSLLVQ